MKYVFCEWCGKKLKVNHKSKKNALCNQCFLAIHESQQVISGGGIYWSCEGCGNSGTIKLQDNTKEFIEEVRGKLGIPAGSCEVEFTKEDGCVVCKPENYA